MVPPVTFPAGSWRFLMLDTPRSISAHTYLILSIGIFPTPRMSFCCLAPLLHSQCREQIIPFLLLDFFTYLWVYLSTSSCFPAPPSLSHPSYYNVLQQRNRCQCFRCLLDTSYVKMEFLALFYKDYSQPHPGWLHIPAQCSSWSPLADIPGMPSVNWLFKPLLENHIRSSQVEAQYRSTADGGLQVHSASALPGLGLSCSVAHREGSPRGGQMPWTPSQLGGHQHSLVPSGMACCCVPLQGPLSLSQNICAWGLGRVSTTAAELSGCRYRWSWALAMCACIGGERLESFHFKLKFIRHPDLSAF